MISVKIKICGITNADDALAAVDMGADLLGFNFYPKSKRYITVDKAHAIINKLPTFVDTVGLFVNATAEEVREVVGEGMLNWIQLHGDETPAFCDSLSDVGVKIIKAIRVRSKKDIESVRNYFVDVILLDAYDAKLYGGTGKVFDWKLVSNIQQRIFLAGGITPENAVEAIEVGVYGIDICSGVESAPGKKDHEKMRKLFENIEHVRG
jgi:phosphoribosylanthranilate isomerase